MTMRRLAITIIAVLILSPAYADDEEDVARIEKYLTGLKSLVATFSQVDAAGHKAAGKFFLKRPGKMRWQYDPPTPLLIVSNGTTITYFDSELDQVNYIPVDESLAGFLAEPTIKLDSESTKLTDFDSDDGMLRVTVVRKGHADEGSLTLEFTEKPLNLISMKVADATGQATTVHFENARIGVVLPEDLFTFDDPRGLGRRRAK